MAHIVRNKNVAPTTVTIARAQFTRQIRSFFIVYLSVTINSENSSLRYQYSIECIQTHNNRHNPFICPTRFLRLFVLVKKKSTFNLR